MVALADCNNFFVSCERVFRPELANKPVIVLSNNDGCAVALSNEAKALGFKRGDPYFKIKERAEAGGAVVFSGNHRLYGDMSARVMTTLRALSSDIEVYSVDEAFIYFPENIGDIADYARYVVAKIRRDTGIPVSIGVAPTKTLAKIASHFAKKYPGYGGACLIDTPEKAAKAMSMTDVGSVWGIGRRLVKRLRICGINTALDLAQLPQNRIEQLFNITGVRTWRELNGEPCISQELTSPQRKTITSSRSFAKELYSIEELHQAFAGFASIAARKLRKHREYALEVEAFIATNRFKELTPQYFNAAKEKLPDSTDSTSAILKAALVALQKIYRPGVGFKRAGITITRIAHSPQPNIFSDTAKMEKMSRLMHTVDSINYNLGAQNSVKIASMGDGLTELTRKEHSSRLFSTRLADIIEVHAK